MLYSFQKSHFSHRFINWLLFVNSIRKLLNSTMKTLNDFNFKDKKALIRVDFNVPLDENFKLPMQPELKLQNQRLLKFLKMAAVVF